MASVGGVLGKATAVIGFVFLAIAWTLPGAAARAAECSNEARRAEQGPAVIALPDCMALEMVSPPEKDSQTIHTPAISADGDRVSFRTLAGIAETPGVTSVKGDFYVASREQNGWTVAPTSAPTALSRGWGAGDEARSFSPDFSHWLQLAATNLQIRLGTSQLFEGGIGGSFLPRSQQLVPVGSKAQALIENGEGPLIVEGAYPQGVSPDRSRVYFALPTGGTLTGVAYLPGDLATESDPNVYVAHSDSSGNPTVELVARDREGKVWGGNCGVRLGGIVSSFNNARNQGAVSTNGRRVFFSTRPTVATGASCNASAISSNGLRLRILMRQETSTGPVITPLIERASGDCERLSPPCGTKDGDDLYQGASVDGNRVYFTTNRQLADSDLDGATGISACTGALVGGCDLYLYEASKPLGERLIQVSAGEPDAPTPGEGAEVLNGTVAISDDGSHVYFVAKGVLTNELNPAGAGAAANQFNFYVYERDAKYPEGHTAFIGRLNSGDANGLWAGNGTYRNEAYPVPVLDTNAGGEEIGGDGHTLLFESKAPLTANDTDGTHSDVYRYDSSIEPPTLQCVSCKSESDSGAFDVVSRTLREPPPNTSFAEIGRWVSEDGGSVVFTTKEGLLPSAEDGEAHSYFWRGGQVYLLPGTSDPSGHLEDQPVLSHDGLEAAFQSFDQLLPSDRDGAMDVYVVRSGGGFMPPTTPPVCSPDASNGCQGPLAAAPPAASPASEAQQTVGNATAESPGKPRCHKGQARGKKGRCVKRHAHRKRHKGNIQKRLGHSKRHVNTDRRAGK